MEERIASSDRIVEVDRDTIGHGNGEKKARIRCSVSVFPFEDTDTFAPPSRVPFDQGTVNLARNNYPSGLEFFL
jgi:hypothetical protein